MTVRTHPIFRDPKQPPTVFVSSLPSSCLYPFNLVFISTMSRDQNHAQDELWSSLSLCAERWFWFSLLSSIPVQVYHTGFNHPRDHTVPWSALVGLQPFTISLLAVHLHSMLFLKLKFPQSYLSGIFSFSNCSWISTYKNTLKIIWGQRNDLEHTVLTEELSSIHSSNFGYFMTTFNS